MPGLDRVQRIDIFSARLFLMIQSAGSIAGAARRAHIVPSAVSRRLAELEAAFSLPLIKRHHRGVSLTPAGEALAHHARTLLQSVEQMQLDLAEYRRGIKGHVRLRCSSSALAMGLWKSLSRFTQRHDGIRLDLEEQDTPQIFREIVAGQADIGVAPDIVLHEGLHLHPCGHYDLCAIAPIDHPVATKKKIRYRSVLNHDLVELTEHSALTHLLDSAATAIGITKRTRIRTLGFESICRMVSAGMGVGIAPDFMAPTHERLYGLRFVPLDESWAHPKISIITRDPARLSSAASLLHSELREAGALGMHAAEGSRRADLSSVQHARDPLRDVR